MPGCQCAPVITENDALEQKRCGGASGIATHTTVGGQDCVRVIPKHLVDQRQVLCLVPLLLVAQFSEVGSIAQQFVDQTLVDWLALPDFTVLGRPRLRCHAIKPEYRDQAMEAIDGNVSKI